MHERLPIAFRCEASAHILNCDNKTAPGIIAPFEFLHFFLVRRAYKNHRRFSDTSGEIEIGRELHAIAHRNLEPGLDVDFVLRKRDWPAFDRPVTQLLIALADECAVLGSDTIAKSRTARGNIHTAI